MSKLWRLVALVCFALAFHGFAAAQTQDASGADATIRQMMQTSADDWNRGDLDAFATAYKNAPDILFIGPKISHGYADMLASYKKNYSTREKMGLLTFSDLAIQPLDARFATVTGWFHLKPKADAPDMAKGYYLLVVEKTPEGWKIIRDDTSAVPVATVK